MTPEQMAEMLMRALSQNNEAMLKALARQAVRRYAGMEPGRPVGGTYYLYRTLRNLDLDDMMARLMDQAREESPEPLTALEERIRSGGQDHVARTLANAIAQAARHGVLIKGGVHLENLGRLQVMAFDKTGTLTTGRFALTDLVPLNGASTDELLILAAAVEQQSSHPLAQAILRAAQDQELTFPVASQVENIPGKGVSGVIEGQAVQIGALRLFERVGGEEITDEALLQAVARLEGEGRAATIDKEYGNGLPERAGRDRTQQSVSFSRSKSASTREPAAVG